MAKSPMSAGSAESTPSSSPFAHPNKPSVQTLLDQLSDSDSEVNVTLKRDEKAGTSQENGEAAGESSDDEIVLGGGRIAARLAGDLPGRAKSSSTARSEAGVALGHDTSETKNANATSSNGVSAHEPDPEIEPLRGLPVKRKRQVDEEDEVADHRSETSSRQSSPSLTASPSPSPRSTLQTASPNASSARKDAEKAGNSKFALLVEKARKQRLAREEAENAKKAVRLAQQSDQSPKRRAPRGSSPADDSEEESDVSEVAAAQRLTTEARPARKASKKALEEMNRETQRMNRNMQLAHQARTKKKFTKESFFAAFNSGTTAQPTAADSSPSSSISVPLSDADHIKIHSTPPTSPMIQPEREQDKITTANTATEPPVQNLSDDDAEDLMSIMAARQNEPLKQHLPEMKQPLSQPAARVAMTGVPQDPDSDSDVEVVFEQGSKRKYAAFENLPRRKAKETPSHLALRSLAQVKPQKSKKFSMTPADMTSFLLKAARKQALEERQAKIEKLRAAGVVVQTAEEKEQAEEELEDLVEKARREEEEIRQREKELAKKNGTYVKDALDDEASDEDSDFEDEPDEAEPSGSDEEDASDGDDEEEADEEGRAGSNLVDDAAEEDEEDDVAFESEPEIRPPDTELADEPEEVIKTPMPSRASRGRRRVVVDEDDDETLQVPQSPALPWTRKTPQSIMRSARKMIPGLDHSDDLPIGLTQAFAATMADSQMDGPATQEQGSMDIMRDLPSPQVKVMPQLHRLESLDMISESVSGSPTQAMRLELGPLPSQGVPESPALLSQIGPSQPFELTQDAGYSYSPFVGNRFAETPSKEPHSTEETVIVTREADSPVLQRRGRLQRGPQVAHGEDEQPAVSKSAFQVMEKAAKRKQRQDFQRKQSEARQAFDEAAEESDDEYAGLGGASDDDSGVEDEEDRRMIDEDTQVGKGDEAKLAKLHADRERESDEQAVSKLLKDITTGALRRKRGVGADLDLSDDEDAAARRRAAKRREFAKMRRELLKDEAVGKIAEDKKKEAFLKSIEDRDDDDEAADDFDQPETPLGGAGSQSQTMAGSEDRASRAGDSQSANALQATRDSQVNIASHHASRVPARISHKPGTLAEIRESVSFLIDEPDSQAGLIDLGLSDSEDEPEAYVNLDRHMAQAEADENALDDEKADLGDFIVEDDDDDDEEIGQDTASPGESHVQDSQFKQPELPAPRDRAPFSERRTPVDVVDRLSLLREQSSSSTGSKASSKMAFVARSSSGTLTGSSLLKRATTNSSLGSISGRDKVSATGVVTSTTTTERGATRQEKEFVRKGLNSARNSINYQARQNLKEERMSARAGVAKKQKEQQKRRNGGGAGFLSALFRPDTWG